MFERKCKEIGTLLLSNDTLCRRIADMADDVKKLYCMIHWYVLYMKRWPPVLKSILNNVIGMVNFVKSNPPSTRLLCLLCQELDAEDYKLLLHTEVRWLSRSNEVIQLAVMKDELKGFFFSRIKKDKATNFAEQLTDNK